MYVNRLMPQLAIGSTILPSIFLFLFIQGSSPLLIQDCAQAGACLAIPVVEGTRVPTHAVQLQPQVSAAPKGAHCMSPASNVCANPGQPCTPGYVCTTIWIKGTRYSKTEVPLEKVPLEKATLDSCLCQCVNSQVLGPHIIDPHLTPKPTIPPDPSPRSIYP